MFSKKNPLFRRAFEDAKKAFEKNDNSALKEIARRPAKRHADNIRRKYKKPERS